MSVIDSETSIEATVQAVTVAAGSIPTTIAIVGGVVTAASAAGYAASDVINTVTNGDSRQYTTVEAAIDAVSILAPTKIGTTALGRVVGVGTKVASTSARLAGKVVLKTGILYTGPGAKITGGLAQSTRGVRSAILSTANKAKSSAVNFTERGTPGILQPTPNYLNSSNVAARFTRFITSGLGATSNIASANSIVNNANATRSILTRRDIPNIDKVSQESGDIAIQMRNENVSIGDASRWIADNYPSADVEEVLRARQIIRNNVDFPVEDDPASLTTTLYREGYRPQDMNPAELVNYIKNARPGVSDSVATSLRYQVLSEYNEKYPRAITDEGVYNDIIKIANTIRPGATEAQKLKALEDISDKKRALRILNEILDKRLIGNIRVTSVKPPEGRVPLPLNPDGTPITSSPTIDSIDDEPIIIIDYTFDTIDSIVPIPTNTLTAPAVPVGSPHNTLQTNTGAGNTPVSVSASPANKIISITGGSVISEEAVANQLTAEIRDPSIMDSVLRETIRANLENKQAIVEDSQIESILNLVKQKINPGSPVVPRVANTGDIQDIVERLPDELGTPTNQVVGQALDATTGQAIINHSTSPIQVEQIAKNQAQAILNANPDINPDTLSNTQILALVDVAFAVDFNRDPFATSIRNYIKVLK
ncbi:hypothetical protein [Microcystis phage LMM01]|uniref:Uncharacterized protein n=1 Tax=Microcystis phage LMM01 TaxID=2856824 RepID=A0A7M6_9CAUD|nr:hypothetical protein MaLMM01_gp112 [Microcystis phage LMM01]BAF36203.1 hypothetical protein [Microcystis phage LMM01]